MVAVDPVIAVVAVAPVVAVVVVAYFLVTDGVSVAAVSIEQ